MKKFFLFAAAVATALTVNAQKVVVLNEVANYIDFQALYEADPTLVDKIPTSTNPVELPNGSILLGFQKSDGSEAANTWNTKAAYNTTCPTPEWDGVDSLTVGTMFRAASGSTIHLGEFETAEAGKLVVYFQPNGDSDRGVEVSLYGEVLGECQKSGVKIDGIRPAYAAEFDLPGGVYDAGDVVIKLISNTSNIFGVSISALPTQGIDKVNASVKAEKFFRDGQLIIRKNGVEYNALGAQL